MPLVVFSKAFRKVLDPVNRIRRKYSGANVLKDMHQVHEISLAPFRYELHKLFLTDSPRSNPTVRFRMGFQKSSDVRTHIL